MARWGVPGSWDELRLSAPHVLIRPAQPASWLDLLAA